MDIFFKIMFLCPCVQHCSDTDTCLIGPCQILFDGFVQTNERLFPHVSLLFSGRVDHLLGGVHQRQQGALKIILLQATGMIWEVRDEPIDVCQLPGNDLLADDFQVSRLEEGSQLGVSHGELPTVLKVYASQQDLVDGKGGQRRAHYWGPFAGFALQTDIFVPPRIIGEHHQRILGRWGSPQFPIPFLFCLQLETGLVGKERQAVRQIPEQTFTFIILSHFCLVIYCCGTKGKAEKQALNSAMKYRLRWGADVLAHVGQRLTGLTPRYNAVGLRYAHRALETLTSLTLQMTSICGRWDVTLDFKRSGRIKGGAAHGLHNRIQMTLTSVVLASHLCLAFHGIPQTHDSEQAVNQGRVCVAKEITQARNLPPDLKMRKYNRYAFA